jgi:hypothetical protein
VSPELSVSQFYETIRNSNLRWDGAVCETPS